MPEHPVTTRRGQRDAHQHVIMPTVGLVARPDHVASGQRPIHFHVAQHVLLREDVTSEFAPQTLPHQAMGPGGTDQVPDPYLLLAVCCPQAGVDPVGVRLEASMVVFTVGWGGYEGGFGV